MNIKTKLITGFGFVILLLIGIGLSAIYSMVRLSQITENMYNHPFTVSNAAQRINTNLIAMHSNMGEVLATSDNQRILTAVAKVNEHERLILDDFDIIFERFLGEKFKIEDAYNGIIEWKPIRDEVIKYKVQLLTGEIIDPDFNLEDVLRIDSEHVIKVNHSVQVLIDYATNKALVFYEQAENSKQEALIVTVILLSLSVLISVGISIYVISTFTERNKELRNYLHMIDQNIMTSSTDSSGITNEVTSALCRFVGKTKTDLLNKDVHFFVPQNNQEMRDRIWRTIETGEEIECEFEIQDIEGQKKWMRTTIHPTFNDSFRQNGYRQIVLDATARKLFENVSITDKMTSLYNRRHFDDVFKKEISIAKRNSKAITLAIIDIDFFKKYNDSYGHPAGDSTLSSVAGLMKSRMKRPNDYVFRLGGEEFGLLFTDLDEKKTFKLLEDIRKGVEELKIEHEDSNVNDYVTISIGSQTYMAEQIPSEEHFYNQADKALYKAKETRNCVISV